MREPAGQGHTVTVARDVGPRVVESHDRDRRAASRPAGAVVLSYTVPVSLGHSPGNSLLVAEHEDAERLGELRRSDLAFRESRPE